MAKLSPADRARLAAMLTDTPTVGSTSEPMNRKPATSLTDRPAPGSTSKAKPKGKSKAKGATNGQ